MAHDGLYRRQYQSGRLAGSVRTGDDEKESLLGADAPAQCTRVSSELSISDRANGSPVRERSVDSPDDRACACHQG